jgi:hypothetical protein
MNLSKAGLLPALPENSVCSIKEIHSILIVPVVVQVVVVFYGCQAVLLVPVEVADVFISWFFKERFVELRYNIFVLHLTIGLPPLCHYHPEPGNAFRGRSKAFRA